MTMLTSIPIQAEISRRITDAITPFAEQIAEIVSRSDLCVVVHDPCEDAQEAARALGWTETNYVGHLTCDQTLQLARSWRTMGDIAAAKWVINRAKRRVMLLIESAHLCLNITPRGLELEPGTTDLERLS